MGMDKVRCCMDRSGMQFAPSDVNCFMNDYHQIMFDIISFYNLGNANQLYRTMTGEWKVFPLFQKNRRRNNQFLSAVWYIGSFLELANAMEADSVKLGHLLFLNALIITGDFVNCNELIGMTQKISDSIGELEGFCEYAVIMGNGFISRISNLGVVNFIRKEIDYLLALPKTVRQNYFLYTKHIGMLIKECENCADRQKNYGITECEFDEVLEMVI